MTNFVDDLTDIPGPKTDLVALTTEDATKHLAAVDWNTIRQACYDMRGKILLGGSGVYDVRNYGAVGDDSTDDRVAVQAAIDACSAAGGGDVYVPNGTYRLTQGAGFYCLTLPANVTLVGESRTGAILKQAASIAASVRLCYPTGADWSIRNLTFDGNKANNTTQEQRHGLFITDSERGLVSHCTFKNFTGDGIFLYDNANNSTFFDVHILDCERNGITFGGTLGITNANVIGGHFVGNAVQQIDSEAGGAISGITINGAYIDGLTSNDYAITCSGVSRTARSSGFVITNCVINGPVRTVWCDDVVITNNRISSASTNKPALFVYRKCVGVAISNNIIEGSAYTGASAVTVLVNGTDDVNGDISSQVVFSNNVVKQVESDCHGFYYQSGNDVVVNGNTFIGANAVGAGYIGCVIRAALGASWPTRSAIVTNNYFKGWGSRAVDFRGSSGVDQILVADCSHNTFDSDTASVMTIGVDWNPDTQNAVQQATMVGNKCVGFCVTEVGAYPSNGIACIGGTYGERGIYSVGATPESALTESIGAVAYNRAGSAVAVQYIKSSGTGNTGWVPVCGAYMQFSVVTSDVASADFANGVKYIPLSPTVENYIAVEGTAPTTGNLNFTVGYQMSAANAGDIRLRVDKRVAADSAAIDTALTTGTAFTVTPGNDVVRHRITSSTNASLTIAVTAGDLVAFKLIRVAADGADTHTGDMRAVDISAVIS